MTTCTATYRDTFFRDTDPVSCFREVDDTGRHRGDHQAVMHVLATPPDPDFPFLGEGRPAYDRLVTWDRGGSSSQAYDPDVPNTNCMCVNAVRRGDDHRLRALGHLPGDHRWATCSDCGVITDATRPEPARCFSCGFWAERVEAYANPDPAPVHNRRGHGKQWSRFVRPHLDAPVVDDQDVWLYGWSQGSEGAFGGRQAVVTWDDGVTVGPASSLWSSGRIPWWLLDKFPPNGTIEWRDTIPAAGHTDAFGRPLTYTGHPPVGGA